MVMFFQSRVKHIHRREDLDRIFQSVAIFMVVSVYFCLGRDFQKSGQIFLYLVRFSGSRQFFFQFGYQFISRLFEIWLVFLDFPSSVTFHGIGPAFFVSDYIFYRSHQIFRIQIRFSGYESRFFYIWPLDISIAVLFLVSRFQIESFQQKR